MTRYKFDRHVGLVDEEGKIILQLVPVGCSKKFREMAGKELANKLNTIEQGKEAVARHQVWLVAAMKGKPMTYRLLNREERIEPGDEVLLDDAMTWEPLDLSGVDRIAGNSDYDPSFHQPMRRKL